MTYPFVSVIIPVRNNPNGITHTLNALKNQTYPKNCFEVIVIDNGSTDNTREVIGNYPVKLLEKRTISNSYAARNTGIKQARGNIIAFTDSDCIPDIKWLKEGVKMLQQKNVDLVGGNIQYTYSLQKGIAEVTDSIVFLQQKENIEQRGGSCTANLFVRKKTFDEIGLFPLVANSGNDIRFTIKASTSGYKLIFSDAAIVKHQARTLFPLIQKAFRIGKGKGAVIRHSIISIEAEFNRNIKRPFLLSQLNPFTLHCNFKKIKKDANAFQFLWSLCICYLLVATGIMGAIWGFVTKNRDFIINSKTS